MAKIALIAASSVGHTDIFNVWAVLTKAGHTVRQLESEDDIYAVLLQHTGFGLYILIGSGNLSQADEGNLRKALAGGKRIFFLYTLQKPAFKAKGFASECPYSSTRVGILEVVQRLTS